ncbi:hypothetical protein ALC57_15728 [Trachymyrmex cornetzi]|uniref:Uncharacterized protein n=1 Tax=Trachymyrmex cornetzi TaxID=471704 RepID=A0A151IWB4_9HYME|nr:hypothetical protein ALC57_15728 [Trachymyrmex cornetzi]
MKLMKLGSTTLLLKRKNNKNSGLRRVNLLRRKRRRFYLGKGVTMVFLNRTPSFSPWDEKADFKPFTKHWLWSTIRPLGSELWTIKVIDELLLALPRNNDVDVVVLCSLRGA